jgi:hypothetical protein
VEREVVPPAPGHRPDRETGPLGELVADQAAHLSDVDGDALGRGAEIGDTAHRDVHARHAVFRKSITGAGYSSPLRPRAAVLAGRGG